MATFNFDINGNPATVADPSLLRFRRTAVYGNLDVYYIYLLIVPFEFDSIRRILQITLYTNLPTVQTYEAANQAGMTDPNIIATSNSLALVTHWDYGNIYSSTIPFVLSIATIVDPDLADGTFSGDLCFYNTAPTIGVIPSIVLPSPADTLIITNGNFTEIPFDLIPV